ncbi:hypothetical protein OIO90_002089 [Microbotryomycetes sp. JL221]|nr:hypothetical protein OIO90_002089 [Microbotryomycetes sp. JL221]
MTQGAKCLPSQQRLGQKKENINTPGLVSALRPVRRAQSQLGEEVQVLRRLVYKNKNQHKNSCLWRKVVEVDRVSTRLVNELQQWTDGFGLGGSKEESFAIGETQVMQALQTSSRPLLLLDKALEVVLGAAAVLEQIIDLKAFMSFTITVMALTARLFTIATAIRSDLEKLVTTLWRIVDSDHLAMQAEVLPRTSKLRDLDGATTSAKSSAQETSVPASDALKPGMCDMDLGEIVSRASLRRDAPAKSNKNSPRDTASSLGIVNARTPFQSAKIQGVVPEEHGFVMTQTVDIKSAHQVVPSKRKEWPVAAPPKFKKTKGSRRHRDEIDDIFG